MGVFQLSAAPKFGFSCCQSNDLIIKIELGFIYIDIQTQTHPCTLIYIYTHTSIEWYYIYHVYVLSPEEGIVTHSSILAWRIP